MVFYYKQGKVPEFRHTFDSKDNILKEELFGEESFDGLYSLLYHFGEPTRVKDISREEKKEFDPSDDNITKHRHLVTSKLERKGNFINGRQYLFWNNRIRIGISKPAEKMSAYMRNALAEELLFFHRGKGKLSTIFGWISLFEGDYVYIPKGTTFFLDTSEDAEILFMESFDRIDLPGRYLNRYGQLREGTPYYTRDFRLPILYEIIPANRYKKVYVDYDTYYMVEDRDTLVFDVAGWDGYLYPYAINIDRMAPIVGKLHQPPPVHENFSGKSFMVGTFLPRPFDFHPRSIPISYYHNNIDTDEFLFYSSGNFMSRKGIEPGSITLHVRGIIHGPQPGAVEASIGAKSTDEKAVMIEAYEPLQLTKTALKIEDKDYMKSWSKE
ncbi:MAG: homogentisate 1,2-dioxygenase [Candidatus Thermoplasmatota archaeon]|nr:homogentisate 1,2-dioxygenase [Candidatus Thermoplasmatota archaeon]